VGLFEGLAEGLDVGAVPFLEAFDLGGEREQQVVVGVAGVRGCGWGRWQARRCSMRPRSWGWL